MRERADGVGFVYRAAVGDDQRIGGRDEGLAWSFPDGLVVNHDGGKRICHARDMVGEVDAAQALVNEALAAGVDHYAGDAQIIHDRERPQVVVSQRVLYQRMAVKVFHADQLGPDGTRHGETIAHRGLRIALADFGWLARDEFPEQFGIGLKAAVADHHVARVEQNFASLLFGLDADALIARHAQAQRARAQQHRRAGLF